MNKNLKFISEFIPLLAFFFFYKFYGLMPATIAVVVLSIITIPLTYYYERKVSVLPLLTTLMLVIFGSVTIYTGNVTFIKIKPTILSFLFAAILFIGIIMKKGLMRYVLAEKIHLSHESWIIFSRRWAIYFTFQGILNEIIWRNFPENIWVNFKVFGILALSILFLMSQVPFLKKHQIEIKN